VLDSELCFGSPLAMTSKRATLPAARRLDRVRRLQALMPLLLFTLGVLAGSAALGHDAHAASSRGVPDSEVRWWQ